MAKSLVLMVDVVSPFAYMAFHLLRNSAVFEGVELSYVPILLGGIIKATKNTPPINVMNKREWMVKERMRWSKLFDIPMADQMPEGFPWNTVQVQRALVATYLAKPDMLAEVLEQLYHLAWVERRGVHEAELYQPVFAKVLGEATAQDILEKAKTMEVKELLTKNTQEALDSGSFGLPWFTATNEKGEKEHFWGFDHIGQVTDFLGLERPVSRKGKEGGWRAML